MPHAYTEENLVELPAFELLQALGWEAVSASEEIFGQSGTLGRETPGEVVLLSRLRPALVKLNPKLPPEAITAAIDELTRDRSAMDPAAANREVYALLKNGVPVQVADLGEEVTPHPDPLPRAEREKTLRSGEAARSARGGLKPERVRLIDWEN